MTDPHGDNGKLDDVPYVAIPNNEDGTPGRAPWADDDQGGPKCGEGPLPLQGVGLTYISHCGERWLRGQPDFDRIFKR